MVSTHLEPLVSDIKLSSVVPSIPTGDNKIHELTNIDLAMKLHYIKGLYFFNRNSVQGIGISDMKKPMFQLLDRYTAASGRIRLSENGRPFVKCNDSGVRIVEADCSKITLEEWMKGMKDGWEINEQLFYPHALGPDLGFAPLVFVQFTWFKCGGLSVGLSWAHVLGDPFAASTFINTWAHIMAGQMPPQPLKLPNSTNTGECQFPPNSNSEKPFSLQRVDTVDDYWLVSSSCKMETLSFHFTARKLDQIASKASGLNQYFHLLAALMWKSLAKIRGESEPRVVTIFNSDPRNKGIEGLSNSQVIGTVEADFKVAEADLSELAKLIEEKMVDERSLIDKWVERENEKSDFILYGSNLTFVNLEESEIYGLRIKGQKPVFASYGIGGAGDEGVVLVLPAPANGKGGDCGDGRVVTAILPKDQNFQLKNELRNDWGVF
ncbi:protein ECERIFERUM 2-like [Rhododendron vialii]|uniref:protein ECERIFERUM 2-like n=1 Tax=Rhododendron vialii TaxID=182163 RepID=UPI00265E0ADF|nr:protein ECERIFERUM 2-like [Rhododendron vialii]XP_058221249.1 protein ECERIFERUM 2-like [Rhododendron vialii]